MNLNVVLPLASSILSFVFFAFLIDQWRERRWTYQLVWAIGMLWYGLSAGTEFLGGAFGWSEPLYRAWYLFVVSVEVFSEIRIPFTHVVLRSRPAEQASQGAA